MKAFNYTRQVTDLTAQKAGEFLSENMRTFYLWSLHKTSDPYRAEDLCSDIILAVMQSAPNLKNDDAFFGFIWKVEIISIIQCVTV